nr:hypothetical protein [Tanacetum cinerariifolium]
MTDYSLWEVILNRDSPVPTIVVEGVVQPVAHTSIEQKLARRNELKAYGTLLMALPDKHQLKFNSHKDAKTLIKAIEKLQKLVSQLDIHEVSLSQEDVNLKFPRSLPSEWKTHTLIWRNKVDLEEHSLDELFNSLKIYEAEVKHSSSTGNTKQNLAFVSSSNIDSPTDSVSAAASASAVCAKLHVSSLPNVDSLSNVVIYSFFASQSTSPQLDNEDLKQIDVDDLEEMDLRWQMAMLTMRARRFLQTKGINLGDNRPTSMGFDMSKVECYNCHKKGHFARECRSPKDSKRPGAEPQRRPSYQVEEEPTNFALMAFPLRALLLIMRSQPSGGYHVIPPLITGTFMPPKPDLVFHTAPIAVKTGHSAFTVSDSEDESETRDPQNVPSVVQSTEQVKTPRNSVQPVETSIPAATPNPTSPKSNSSGKRNNRKTCFVCKSVDHLIKDCDYHTKKMAQPIPRNYPHRGNNKQNASLTHKHPLKHMVPATVLTQSKPVSITTVRQVSAAVPKIMVTQPRLAHPIVTKSKSPIRRHIICSQSSKTSPVFRSGSVFDLPCSALVDMLPLEVTPRVVRFLAKERLRQNYDGDAPFNGKEHDFDTKNPEFEVIISPSNSAQSRKQDDKIKKEAKGKSPVESFTGNRDLSAEFEDCSDNSRNEVNAAGSIVPTVGQNSSNITNPFSAVGPSNTTSSPTHGKSSFIDASQLSDDPVMPELEDITYSYDENDVGAEADFNNLENSIIVSPIPTTRIHKDHLVSQIIGFEDPDHPDKVYKVVKALYGLQQARRACQDKYLAEILRKFGLIKGKSASTPIDTKKPLLKDPDAYSDSDYAGASLDKKSTTGGCQFLGCRLISWQCKKQIIVATSSTKDEYVAAASCCA